MMNDDGAWHLSNAPALSLTSGPDGVDQTYALLDQPSCGPWSDSVMPMHTFGLSPISYDNMSSTESSVDSSRADWSGSDLYPLRAPDFSTDNMFLDSPSYLQEHSPFFSAPGPIPPVVYGYEPGYALMFESPQYTNSLAPAIAPGTALGRPRGAVGAMGLSQTGSVTSMPSRAQAIIGAAAYPTAIHEMVEDGQPGPLFTTPKAYGKMQDLGMVGTKNKRSRRSSNSIKATDTTAATASSADTADAADTADTAGGANPAMRTNSTSSITSTGSSSARKQFVCLDPSCRSPSFTRQADLERHVRHLHTDAAEKDKFICDYPDCSRHTTPFHRKDHYREHLRDNHSEDLLKRGSNAGQSLAPRQRSVSRHSDDGRRLSATEPGSHGHHRRSKQQMQEDQLQNSKIDSRWWRCARCLARVDIDVYQWTCPTCKGAIEDQRLALRMKKQVQESACYRLGLPGYV